MSQLNPKAPAVTSRDRRRTLNAATGGWKFDFPPKGHEATSHCPLDDFMIGKYVKMWKP
jgi:hypothetical protein